MSLKSENRSFNHVSEWIGEITLFCRKVLRTKADAIRMINGKSRGRSLWRGKWNLLEMKTECSDELDSFEEIMFLMTDLAMEDINQNLDILGNVPPWKDTVCVIIRKIWHCRPGRCPISPECASGNKQGWKILWINDNEMWMCAVMNRSCPVNCEDEKNAEQAISNDTSKCYVLEKKRETILFFGEDLLQAGRVLTNVD